MAFYEGQRLSFDGNLCTVRYHGPLEGTQGDWLGVEWDDDTRGKHNGIHKDQSIFSCLSASPIAASFIRPTRKPDQTRTVLEAIKFKYGQTQQTNGRLSGPGYDIIEISKKKVEEVGFDKIKLQMSQLDNLKVAIIDQLCITGLTTFSASEEDVSAAQNELATTCPSIAELEIGWNLFERWDEIIDVCAPLQKLRTLKASGLRLKSLKSSQSLSQVAELHLNECLLSPTQILELLNYDGKPTFPNLRTLWLSQNALDSFDTASTGRVFNSIKTLVMENNKFTNLVQVAKLCQHFPSIDSLSLQRNLIQETGTRSTLSSMLTGLNLASNKIADFSFIDSIPNLFPNLSSLRMTSNPLYDRLAQAPPSTTSDQLSTPTNANKPSDAPFYLTLARIPNLQTLNYTTITPRDREEGEIYYISLVDKAIRATLSTTSSNKDDFITVLSTEYPLYPTLTAKYERPDLLNLSSTDPTLLLSPIPASVNFAANASLASRLVMATFHLVLPTSSSPSTNSSPYTTVPSKQAKELMRPLPTTTPVYTLKALLARHFSLPSLQFKLIYESEELDPEQITTTKLWGSSKEEWVEWGRWDADLASETGQGATEADNNVDEAEEKWVENGKVLLKGGTRWRKREVEILDGMRGWGDYLDLDGEVRTVRVRVEPFSPMAR